MAAVPALRTGARPRPTQVAYDGLLSHDAVPSIASLLRGGKPPQQELPGLLPEPLLPAQPPAPVVEPVQPEVMAPAPAPQAQEEAAPSEPKEIVLELNKVNGKTESVNIRVGDKVRTLSIKRNEVSK